MDAPKLNEFSLKNGLQCLTYDMPARESVAIGIWVKMGGRYESLRHKGIAHFIEHMLFKGSAKYSCRKIKEELEGVGASLNGFTSAENTCYLAKLPKEHLFKGLDVLSDMVLNPVLDEMELEKERMVILEEIRMYKDLPQHYVFELAEGLLWKGHVLGHPLAGTEKTVMNITRSVMKDFHSKYYRPKNIVVAAAGAIPNGFKQMVEEIFLGKPPGKKSSFKPFKLSQSQPRINILSKNTEQAHLCIAYPAFHRLHPLKYAQSVLNVIIAGNMSSRLFDEVREKRGLAYHISSSVVSLMDTGAVFIKVGTDNSKVEKTVDVILKQLGSMHKGKISKKEFSQAKKFLLGQVTLNLEDTMEAMLFLGERKTTSGEMELPNEIKEKIKRVTIDEVKQCAARIISPRRLNVALISSISEKQKRKIQKLSGL